MNQSNVSSSAKVIPPIGWALANIICLVNESVDSGWFNQALDCTLYARAVITLAENLLAKLESFGCIGKENHKDQSDVETFIEPIDTNFQETEPTNGSLKTLYIDLFKPVCQQWHLTNLLAIIKKDGSLQESNTQPQNGMTCLGMLKLLDIAYFYSYILRILSFFSPTIGSLSALNMLSFTPGFLVSLWGALECFLFPRIPNSEKSYPCISKASKNKEDFKKQQKECNKVGTSKWATVLQKFTAKSQPGFDCATLVDDESKPSQVDEDSYNVWDVEALRHGPEGISKDMSCLLHLFSATYAHLLLILDDIEFYEKQVNYIKYAFCLSNI